jgi:flagellar protein FlbD
MIELTRLNSQLFYLNCDLIQTIEVTPNTVIHLVSGESIVVREAPEEVVERVAAFRARCWVVRGA